MVAAAAWAVGLAAVVRAALPYAGGGEVASGKKYVVEKGPDIVLATGGKGSLYLRLSARQDGYIPPDAPLRIKLSADGAVVVERSLLRRDDAVDPQPGARAHELAFRIVVAAGPGAETEGMVEADVLFYVGSGEWARPVRETLRWTVPVRRSAP
jgi:hypothetical protein